jgi:hypothetical protein
MIIKTEELERQLEENLFLITPDKKHPLVLKGSYKFRPMQSLVTDIDYTGYVKYNEKLRTIAIETMLRRIKKSGRFIFMDFSCGVYKDFAIPWKIIGTGCEFDYDKTIEWYNNLKQKKLMKKETEDFIENRLFKDTLSIKELIEIERELEPYYDIKWSETEIFNGYKIDIYDKTTKYEFLDTLKNNIGVLKFLFVYFDYENKRDDYIMIDVRLIDYVIEESSSLPAYYTEDWYKIFKGYKWKVKEEYKEEYTNALLKVDYQNALLNRLKMLKKINKYNLLSQKQKSNIEFVIREELFNEKSGLNLEQLQKLNISQIISTINKKINDSLENDVNYFRNKIKNEDILKQDMFFDRAIIYAKTPVSIREIQKRTTKGIKCPFFDIDDNEYDFLYKQSFDFLLNPVDVINCFIKIANENDILIKDMVNINNQPKIILKIDENNPEIIEIYVREYRKYYNKYREEKVKIIKNKLIEFDKKYLPKIQEYLVKTLFKY